MPIYHVNHVSTNYWSDYTNRYTVSSDTTVATPIVTSATWDKTFTFKVQYINQFFAAAYKPESTFDPVAYAAKLAKEEKARFAAQKKARFLLKENLSAIQWKQFLDLDYFEVISVSGEVYRIKRGRSRNVTRIVNGQAVEILCAHPQVRCPDEDTMLAQKFMLETDEAAFRKVANIEQIHGKPEGFGGSVINHLYIGAAA